MMAVKTKMPERDKIVLSQSDGKTVNEQRHRESETLCVFAKQKLAGRAETKRGRDDVPISANL